MRDARRKGRSHTKCSGRRSLDHSGRAIPTITWARIVAIAAFSSGDIDLYPEDLRSR